MNLIDLVVRRNKEKLEKWIWILTWKLRELMRENKMVSHFLGAILNKN